MENLKKYNEFLNENIGINSTYIMNANELLQNKTLVNGMKSLLSKFPDSWGKKINRQFVDNTINIQKIMKIDKKYNIIKKVKNLMDKGVTNMKDIYTKLVPHNESIFLAVSGIILILIGIGCLIWMYYNIAMEKTPYLPGVVFAAFIIMFFYFNIQEENKIKDETPVNKLIVVDENGHTDTLYVKLYDNGKYEIINEK